MKKILSLILAFALMLSILVIPAAAAVVPDEEIVKPLSYRTCPICTDPAYYSMPTYVYSGNVYVETYHCTKVSYRHTHWVDKATVYSLTCSNCGQVRDVSISGYNYCNAAGVIIYDPDA